MRFTVQFPLDEPDGAEAAVDSGRLAEFAVAAERAGFDAIGFTEHPAPSADWLHGAYGHASLDPFTALGYCAAVTSDLRLMTYLAVLPYRHPLVTAKAAATVDRLSGGRHVLCVGAGYLEEEFKALGVRFGDRAERMEEGLIALHAAWSAEDPADGSRPEQRPRPAATGGPPVWIGGNSRRARRQVARYGHGWSPLLVEDALASELSTAGLGSLALLRAGVEDLRGLTGSSGRDPAGIEVQVKGSFSRVRLDDWNAEAHLQVLTALADAGATWVVVHPVAPSREGLLDVLRAYGTQIIHTVREERGR